MIGDLLKSKSFCIICGEERDGIEIKEDNVLNILRRIKRLMGKKAGENRLVVCRACYPKYRDYRKKYISRQRIYVALGVAFLIFGMLIAPSLLSLLAGLVITAFLYGLSLLNYTPAIDASQEGKHAASAKPVPVGKQKQ